MNPIFAQFLLAFYASHTWAEGMNSRGSWRIAPYKTRAVVIFDRILNEEYDRQEAK